MKLQFSRRARDQLFAIEAWIAQRADRETAERVVDMLLDRCGSLTEFPDRGSPRDDVRPGLRTIPYRGRYTISYRVIGEQVIILGVTGRGQPLSELTDDN